MLLKKPLTNQVKLWGISLGLILIFGSVWLNYVRSELNWARIFFSLFGSGLIWLEISASQLAKSKLQGLILGLTFIFGVSLFGQSIQAKWWLIDDHELITIFGLDHQLKFSEIPAELLKTEVGKVAEFPRFRPSYWLIRLTEAAIWGENPGIWYAFRLGIILTAMASFWLLVAKRFGYGIAGGLLMYVWSLAFWSDIFARLGPAEIYCVLGLSLFCWGADLLASLKPKNLNLGFWLLFWGSIIAAGSKENFIFLSLPMLVIGWWSLKQRLWTPLRLGLWLASLEFMIAIGLVTVAGIMDKGSDIYSQSISLAARSAVLMTGLITRTSLILLGIAVTAGLVGIFKPLLRAKSRQISLVVIGFWVIYLFNWVFYNGYWPLGNRYDFPVWFVLPAAWLLLVSLGYSLLKFYGWSETKLLQLRLMALTAILGLCLNTSYSHLIKAVTNNVVRTNAFTKVIQSTTRLLHENPDKALVIEAGEAWDMEPFWSYVKFFRHENVKNPIYLKVNFQPNSESTTNDRGLHRLLSGWSKFGFEGMTRPLYMFKGQKCWSIPISGTSTTQCDVINVSELYKAI